MDCKLDNQTIDYSNYTIAAFVGDECRGVGEVMNAGSKQIIYMSVYSNVALGEDVTFKIYGDNCGIVAGTPKVTFESDKLSGSPSSPFMVTFNTGDVTKGDVNEDGLVNITDVVTTVNYILGISVDNFNEAAADIDEDGIINITDVVGIVSIILNQ